ncbi:hypothetical protein, partial [Mycoplasma phocimorsus]|uniref:hypothetical protein n=1 Tax=Mycoplasma phocimorsus TaxID=3045839 RepID=UPI0024BFDC3A
MNRNFTIGEKITKKQFEANIKLYKKHEYTLVYDQEKIEHTLISYNTLKEIKSSGDNMTRKEFENFKSELLNIIKKNENQHQVDKLEIKQSFDSFRNEILEMRKADKIEMKQSLDSFRNEILEMRKADKLEMKQSLDSFRNEILEMRKADKIEMKQSLDSFRNEILEMRKADKLEMKQSLDSFRNEILEMRKA